MDDPLTGGTGGAAHMATELLKYANRAKVAAALTESGYPVTRMTVNRWAAGGEMPGVAVNMVLKLFGHTPDTTKEPPPEWAGAMEARLTKAIADLPTVLELARGAADEAERERDGLPPGGGSGQLVVRDREPG